MDAERNFVSSDNITNLDEAKSEIKLQRAVLKTIADLVEFRDYETGGHIERTQDYFGVLTGELIKKEIYTEEIDSWDDIWLVLNSIHLHDVGKIGIKDSILQKPGKLTDEEFEQMKQHVLLGEKIIERIEKDSVLQNYLKHAKIVAGTHHEKWDGSGYPRGLKGREIPLEGRLMAVADVYDALMSERPYKKAFSHDEAVEIIRKNRETHFDPVLTDLFLQVSHEFKKIATMYRPALR